MTPATGDYGVFFGPGALAGSLVGVFGCASVFSLSGTPGESPAAGSEYDASALRNNSLRPVAAATCRVCENTLRASARRPTLRNASESSVPAKMYIAGML